MANATTASRVTAMIESPNAAMVDAVVALVEEQLCLRLGTQTVPDRLQYIAVNVSVARYNQIGDEGKSAMTIEGESADWLTDLFAPYAEDIRKYLDEENGMTGGVRIRFL